MQTWKSTDCLHGKRTVSLEITWSRPIARSTKKGASCYRKSGKRGAEKQTDRKAQYSVTVSSDFLTQMSDSKFGFSSFAEQWNGRLAMLGFVIGLGTELLTGQGILSQVGLG
jgi:ferrochelatase